MLACFRDALRNLSSEYKSIFTWLIQEDTENGSSNTRLANSAKEG